MPTGRDVFDLFLWFTHKLGWGWAVSIFLAVGLLVLGFLFLRRRRDSTQLYENRATLDEKRGGIRSELGKLAESFWVMWPAGHVVDQLDHEQILKIRRMILGNPTASSETLETYSRYADAGGAEHLRQVIQRATQRMRNAEVLVRWADERSVSIVIANPTNTEHNGWARLEFTMPFLPSPSRPSIVIRQKDRPQLFDALVQAYERFWNDSIEPSDN